MGDSLKVYGSRGRLRQVTRVIPGGPMPVTEVLFYCASCHEERWLCSGRYELVSCLKCRMVAHPVFYHPMAEPAS